MSIRDCASVPALPLCQASPFSVGVQDGHYRSSAAWRLRDARLYFPLPTVRAFGWIAPPTMPSADFCAAVRPSCDGLSPKSETQRRPPRPLMAVDFAIACSLVRPGRPRYPVLIHRAAALLHASFRRRLATTSLRFANPSPPSGWIEDFHLQAVDHARHTRKRARIAPRPPDSDLNVAILGLLHRPRPQRLEHEQRQSHHGKIHQRGDDEHHVPTPGRRLDQVGNRHQEG